MRLTPPTSPRRRRSKRRRKDKEEKPVPEPKLWTSRHQIRIGGKAIDYEATAGTLLMKNDKDEPIALFGFTAYVRQGQDGRTRPIVFAYNGGPGSASAWLHMGILGPRRAVLEDLTSNTRGPFKLVDNEFSFLDRADLVLIDPVGTGFSRPVGKAEGKQFWGVDNDIRSVSDFIVRYLGEYKRWASPKFILGESYGGIRTGGVTYDLLTRHNVALNGIILVSPYMDFVTGTAGLNSRRGRRQLHFHVCGDRVVSQGAQPATARAGCRSCAKSSSWVDTVYQPVLYKGARATAEERQAALDGLARYTGVSAAYWDASNLRMDENHFLQELMRAQGTDARAHRFALRRRHAEQDRGDHGVRSLCERHRAGDRRHVQRLCAQRAGRGLGTEVRALGAALQGLGPRPRAAGYQRQEGAVRQRAARPLICDDDESEDEGPGAAGLFRSGLSVRHREGCIRPSQRSRPSCARTCTSSTTKRGT